MRLKLLFFVALCLSFLSVRGQFLLDSLKTELSGKTTGADSVELLQHIAEIVAAGNPNLNRNYADTLESIVERHQYYRGHFYVNHFRGQSYYEDGNYEEAEKYFREELKYVNEFEDSLSKKAQVLNDIAICLGEFESSESAIEVYLQVMDIYEAIDDQDGVAIVHNNIGSIYSDAGAYPQALNHFQKGLKIREALGLTKKIPYCYDYISTVYDRMGEVEKSIYYSKKALRMLEEQENWSWAGIAANNMAATYNKMDDSKIDSTIFFANLSLDYFKKIENKRLKTYPLNQLIEAYTRKNDYQKAIEIGMQGWAIVQELGLTDMEELYFRELGEAHEALGNYKEAFHWYRQYLTVMDTIIKNANMEQVAEIEAKYETQKNEAEIAQKDLELTQKELEVSKQRNIRNRIIIGASLLLLLFTGILQYFRNKDRLKKKEAELAYQLEKSETEKLREVDRLKSNFFTNISHEFRTPLTLIKSPLQQFIDGSFKGEKKRYYQIMLRNCDRLMNLVNQLLDLSKLESGKMKLQAAEGDLAKLLRSLGHSFESLAVRKQIDFQVNVPEAALPVYYDAEKLEKVIINLLSNAFKFTNEEKSIEIGLEKHKEQAKIWVKDSGVGISEEQLKHIFDRFYSVQKSEQHVASSGIGLTLTKELIELHHGSIRVRSEENKGSIFEVFLPLGKDHLQPEELIIDTFANTEAVLPILLQTNQEVEVENNITIKANQPFVLIVEDNPDVRTYIKDQLQDQYQVLEAPDGRHGLELAKETVPDLIISDVMMPFMDGVEMAGELKKEEKTSHIPIIMLTAKAEREDKLEGLELGVDDYLIKPFDAKELRTRVQNLIDQRKRLQEKFGQQFQMNPTKVEVQSIDREFLMKVKEVIENQMDDETFSVVELSSQLAMSRSQLHRKLKALLGQSPNQIIREMRLKRAKELLEKDAGNASEVAFMVGFNSSAYFSKCFSDYFGFPPSKLQVVAD